MKHMVAELKQWIVEHMLKIHLCELKRDQQKIYAMMLRRTCQHLGQHEPANLVTIQIDSILCGSGAARLVNFTIQKLFIYTKQVRNIKERSFSMSYMHIEI